MNKAIICLPEEMNQLQYIEESKMTFEERLRLAFNMHELSKLNPSKSNLVIAGLPTNNLQLSPYRLAAYSSDYGKLLFFCFIFIYEIGATSCSIL